MIEHGDRVCEHAEGCGTRDIAHGRGDSLAYVDNARMIGNSAGLALPFRVSNMHPDRNTVREAPRFLGTMIIFV
jgi:hypothetical protein